MTILKLNNIFIFNNLQNREWWALVGLGRSKPPRKNFSKIVFVSGIRKSLHVPSFWTALSKVTYIFIVRYSKNRSPRKKADLNFVNGAAEGDRDSERGGPRGAKLLRNEGTFGSGPVLGDEARVCNARVAHDYPDHFHPQSCDFFSFTGRC